MYSASKAFLNAVKASIFKIYGLKSGNFANRINGWKNASKSKRFGGILLPFYNIGKSIREGKSMVQFHIAENVVYSFDGQRLVKVIKVPEGGSWDYACLVDR